ncbi:MAG TPA: hypothetical protein VE224_19375, partial [Pseudolabrys sp.]|nr:hypothetical protein [Pseudolabrys sp.]
MSAPVDRSSSRDEFLEYAPKRIRDRTMSGQRESRSSSDDETNANGTFSFDQDAEGSRTSHAIEPTLVPEPPSKSWREAIAAASSGSDYDGGQDDSTKHVMWRSLLVLVVAALVAFGIVVFGPAARQLIVKSQSAITQMAL